MFHTASTDARDMLYKITGRVLHNPLNLRRLCACGVHQVHVVRFIILGLLSHTCSTITEFYI